MPPRRSTPKILHQAGELRKQATPAEKKLWAYLRLMREEGVRFRRQYAIGPFITDFCSPRRKIIIELDGSQHLPGFDRRTPEPRRETKLAQVITMRQQSFFIYGFVNY